MASIPIDKMFFHSNQTTLKPADSEAKRVLLVDDDHASIVVVNRMLESLGFCSHAVNSGVAARECISQYNYDLLVSDLQMPEVDGYMLSGFVKKTSQATKVIIMTGLESEDVADYMNTGIIDGWLFKPFSTADLRKAILRCRLIEPRNISSFPRGSGCCGDAPKSLNENQELTDP